MTNRFSAFAMMIVIFGLLVGAAMLAGCSTPPNLYKPDATPTNLAAYAAATKYPIDQTPQENLHLVAIVKSDDKRLVIRNFGGPALANFNLWVNQTYVIHLDRLDTGKSKLVNLSDLYNSAGNNDLTPDKVTRVQVVTIDGKLFNVQGPQVD